MSYKILTIDSGNYTQESYFTDKESFDKAIKYFSINYWLVCGYEKNNEDWKAIICFYNKNSYQLA